MSSKKLTPKAVAKTSTPSDKKISQKNNVTTPRSAAATPRSSVATLRKMTGD